MLPVPSTTENGSLTSKVHVFCEGAVKPVPFNCKGAKSSVTSLPATKSSFKNQEKLLNCVNMFGGGPSDIALFKSLIFPDVEVS